MEPFHEGERVKLWRGDCVELMAQMPENSVDAIVTDPPYGLEFMGKEWDKLGGDARMSAPGIGERVIAWPAFGGSEFGRANPTCSVCGGRARGAKPCTCERPHDNWMVKGKRLGETNGFRRADNPADVERESVHGRTSSEYKTGLGAMQVWHERWARAALRVLKPGGHLVAAGGTRTFHRLVCALEDAGFEIRDTLLWMYGQGFPKSLNVSKAIDKAAGADREVLAIRLVPDMRGGNLMVGATSGKPEPKMEFAITVPATDDAKKWDGWGTALKPAVEFWTLARKPLSEPNVAANVLRWGTGGLNVDGCRIGHEVRNVMVRTNTVVVPTAMAGASTGATASGEKTRLGRWPANFALAHVEQCVQVGEHGLEAVPLWACVPGCPVRLLDEQSGTLTSGKARVLLRKSDKFRNTYRSWSGQRVEGATFGDSGGASRFFYTSKADKSERRGSKHPTMKPLDLMCWLCRLVTPPGGIVLDPFLGSGTTVEAARMEGFEGWGIDVEAEYVEDAKRRVQQEVLF